MYRLTCTVLPLLLVGVTWARTIEIRNQNVSSHTTEVGHNREMEDDITRIHRPDYCDVVDVVETTGCGGTTEAFHYDAVTGNCMTYLRENCSTSLNTFDTYESCMKVCDHSAHQHVEEREITEEKMPCNCDWSYFRHYLAKQCTPVYNDQECHCPVRFDCPTNVTHNRGYECTLKGKTYKIGEPVNTTNPCDSCTCTADFISCDPVECASLIWINKPLQPGCHYIYEAAPNDCCPKIACYNVTDEAYLNAPRCEYKGRRFVIGERILPREDPCLSCFCTNNWTGLSDDSCHRHDCLFENDLPDMERGCIPIYQEDVCCPEGYHCPKEDTITKDGLVKSCLLPQATGLCDATFLRYFYNRTSGRCEQFTYGGCGGNLNNFETLETCQIVCGARRNEPVPESFKENMCYFDHWYYPLGANLEIEHESNCVTCTCSVPPDFTCILRSCPPPPNDDYKNCVMKFKPNACCPDYECSQVTTVCPEVDCSEPGCVLKQEPGGCGHCECVNACPSVTCATGCSLEEGFLDGRCPECICNNATRKNRDTICPTPQCAHEECKIVDGPEGCPTCQCPNHCPVLNCEPGCELVKDYPGQECSVCRCDSRNDIVERSCITPKCDKYCHLATGGDGCPQCICEPLCLPTECACSEPKCELAGCELEKDVPYGRCPGCVCPAKGEHQDKF